MPDTATAEDYVAPHERRWKRAWQAPFLRALSLIDDVSSACRVSNVSRQSAYRMREQNPEFAAAWDDAREHAKDLVERTAHQWITTGVPVKQKRTRTVTKTTKEGTIEETIETIETESSERSAALMIFWLKAHHPDRYRFADLIEHSGGSKPVEISVTKEELDTAVERFDSTVVRLADRRAAKASSS